jgi:hypothetical protein
MSEDSGFAPPPFKPLDALAGLKRQLRDLKLTERAGAFELRGSGVVQLQAGDTTIEARLAKRPARAPEWTVHTLKSGADVRRFVDAVKQQLARWSAADE